MRLKTIISNCIILSFITFCSACSTVYMLGTDFDDTLVESISVRKTSSSEIKDMLGEPYRKGRVDESPVWIYLYEEYAFPAQADVQVKLDTRHKSLVLVFDENMLVKHITYNVPHAFSAADVMMIHEEKLREYRQQLNVNRY